MKLIWRSIVFVVTLMFIYLLFPILIVPSSLPAINEAEPADAQIFQLESEPMPTLAGWLKILAVRHRQGRYLIWLWLTQTAF